MNGVLLSGFKAVIAVALMFKLVAVAIFGAFCAMVIRKLPKGHARSGCSACGGCAASEGQGGGALDTPEPELLVHDEETEYEIANLERVPRHVGSARSERMPGKAVTEHRRVR